MKANSVLVGAAVASCVLLSGCSLLGGGGKTDQLYVLRPASVAVSGTPLSAVLAVPRPSANPGLDTDRIALARAGNELDYYAGSHYGDTLTRVLGVLAVQTLAGGDGFVTTTGDRAAVHSDYDLVMNVRRFEADYSGNSMLPEVKVEIDCMLIATSPRVVLGSCDGVASEPVAANRMSEIVAALERGTQQALAQIRTKAVALARAAPPVPPIKK